MDINQLTDSSFIGAIAAGLILAAFVTLAILLRVILAILTKRTNKDNADRLLLVIVGSIKGPTVLFVITLGLLFGYFTISRIEEGIFGSGRSWQFSSQPSLLPTSLIEQSGGI